MSTDLVRVIRSTRDAAPPDGDATPRREWLVVNGLGGYSSGTVAGVVTRRYHGLLVASLPAPLGRVVMLNHLLERVRLPTRGVLWLGDEDEVAGPNATDRADHLVEFRLELGMPVWRYEIDGYAIEKRVLMPHGQNTVHVNYTLVAGEGPVRMTLRPSVQFRGYESPVNESPVQTYSLTATGRRYELSGGADFPCLRMALAATPPGVDTRRKGRLLGAVRLGEAPRVSGGWVALEPWLLPSGSDAGRQRHAHRLDRVVGSHRGAHAGGCIRRGARSSPKPSRHGIAGRRRPFLGAARAGSRPVHHHAGRSRRRRRRELKRRGRRSARSLPATTGSRTGAATR